MINRVHGPADAVTSDRGGCTTGGVAADTRAEAERWSRWNPEPRGMLNVARCRRAHRTSSCRWSPYTDLRSSLTSNMYDLWRMQKANNSWEIYRDSRRRFWHATQDCVAPYVDHILHRDRFWVISTASGSVRLWDLRPCCMVHSHVMWGHPPGLLQSSGGRVDRILLASVLSSIGAMCPERVRQRDWTIAVSLVCPVSLRTSSFRTNWCHLIPSSIRRNHWSKSSIFRASVVQFKIYSNT